MGPPSKVALASVLVLKINENSTQSVDRPSRLVLHVGGERTELKEGKGNKSRRRNK